MPFTLSAAQTIAGIANSYEVTGSGNLDDLASAFSTVGCTRTGNTLVFDSGGVARIYAVSGTLTEQREGNYYVIVQNGAHVNWAYAAAANVTLGKYDITLKLATSSVHIDYRQNAAAFGYSQFEVPSRAAQCIVGLGTFLHDSGSVIYDQSGRNDLDVPNSKTNPTAFNNVLLATGNNQSFTHTHTNAFISTSGLTRFKLPGPFEVDGLKLTTVQPLSTNVGCRVLNATTGAIRLLRQTATQLDTYAVSSTLVLQSVDPQALYHSNGGQLGGIKQIFRTLFATAKTPLGANISDAKLVIVPLNSGTTGSVTTFTGSTSSEVRQSTAPHGVAYNASGTGYTDTSQYQVSVLAFGYPSTPTTYDVKTNAGTSGVAVAAVLSKSAFVTTPYASVVTAPFSFSTTGSGTLTVATSATVAQMAEYLFKLAYDNADAAFWRGLSHTPVTQVGTDVSFGAISISVSSGATVTGSSFRTTGTITNAGTITPTFTDSAGTRVTIRERTDKLLSTYVTINGTPVGGTVVDGTLRAGWVPLSAARVITVQPADAVRIAASYYGSKPTVFNMLGSEIDKFTLSLDTEPAIDTTTNTTIRDAITASFSTVINGATLEVTINRTLKEYTPKQVLAGLDYYIVSKGYLLHGAIAANNNASLYSMSEGTIVTYSPAYKIRMADLDSGGAAIVPTTVGYEVPLVIYYEDPLTSVKSTMTLLNASGAFLGTAPWTQMQASIGDADQSSIAAKVDASTVLAKEATVATRASQASVTALGTPLQASSYTAPDNAGITAIKAKTDTLVNGPTLVQIEGSTILAKESTLAGKASQASVTALGTPMQAGEVVDANIVKVNDVFIDGVGTQADPFGPV
jgi:hypothetical protein